MSPKLSPNLEPGTRRFLEQVNAQGGKPIYELSPVDARKVLSDLQAGEDVEKLPADIEERGGPRIASQVLFYPVTDANFETGTYHEFATGYFLARDGMRWFWDNYLPNVEERARPHASPLRASLEELKGLPPALVIVGEHDVLRDEVEAYAHKLAEAGVRVEATRFLGTMHDFVMLNPITDTPAPRAAIRLATETLRRVFGEVDQAGRRTALGAEATAPLQH
jgi:acetyl esterase